MTDLQLYILVAIPLVGILSNTALFIHVSSRVDRLAEGMREDLKAINSALVSLEADVAVLKDRAKLG